jgi:ABC-type glycerol-3-phosphate transport system substrate-binding protein
LLTAVRDRKIRFDGERFAEIYTQIKDFSRYWQRGFHGANSQTAYHLFLTGKAAMLLETSAQISQLLRDMEDLPARARFHWDVFSVPPLTSSRFRVPPFRGVGGAGVMWGVTKKSAEQTRRVVDFLMYLTTPHAAQTLVEQAVRHRRPLIGPMLIPGAEIPERIRRYFRAFEGRGFEKLSFRGLMDEQQSVWEWTVWAQRYMDGRLSLSEFLQRYQRLMERAVPRVIAMQKLDMNPRTKDKK